MTRTLQGWVHGRTIELEEDLGVADGQKVEVQVKVVSTTTATKPTTSPRLAEIYAILGERYDTGQHDLAERHNEHQP